LLNPFSGLYKKNGTLLFFRISELFQLTILSARDKIGSNKGAKVPPAILNI